MNLLQATVIQARFKGVIKVNRQAQPTIEYIGTHKTPIIVIDDYAVNRNDVISMAASHGQFEADNVTNYPGNRLAIPKELVVEYLQPVMQALYGIFNFPNHLKPMPKDNYFSLITKQPEELSTMQSWPHFDTAKPTLIAVIHYLSDGEHGGALVSVEESSLFAFKGDKKKTGLIFSFE